MSRESLSDKGLPIAGAAALALVVMGFVWSRLNLHNVCDDSLIALHYARNVAEGHGFVFNPGERIEGYTNFLWIWLTSLLYPLSDGTSEGFVRVAVGVSVLLSGLCAFLVYWVARLAWGLGVSASLLAVAYCLADNDFSVWSIHGMEIHLQVLLMLLSMLLWWAGRSARSAIGAGLCLALCVMTRPDAATWPMTLLAGELAGLRRPTSKHGWRRLLLAFGTAAVVYGSYFAWRVDYYGWLLPNTYYLKADGLGIAGVQRGLDYLGGYLRVRLYLPILALGALWIPGDRVARTLLAWGILHVGYVTYIGGDFYLGHRFLVVLAPVLGLLLAGAVDAVSSRAPSPSRSKVVFVGAALVVALVAIQSGLRGPGRTDVMVYANELDRRRRVAVSLGEQAPKGATIAAEFLGESGYFARLRVFDIYGIINPNVAHRQIEGFGTGSAGHEKSATVDEVLAYQPTFIRHRDWNYDFYQNGYYFDPLFPEQLKEPGVWRADDMGERGDWLENTHIPFVEQPCEGWVATGTAFERWPTKVKRKGRMKPNGAVGWYISTYHRRLGHLAEGVLTSAPFELVGDLMVLRVGGGHDPERLRVELLIHDVAVRSATGPQHATLARQAWDIAALRGQRAQLRVVDESQDPFGYLSVDEVRQWKRAPDDFSSDGGGP